MMSRSQFNATRGNRTRQDGMPQRYSAYASTIRGTGARQDIFSRPLFDRGGSRSREASRFQSSRSRDSRSRLESSRYLPSRFLRTASPSPGRRDSRSRRSVSPTSGRRDSRSCPAGRGPQRRRTGDGARRDIHDSRSPPAREGSSQRRTWDEGAEEAGGNQVAKGNKRLRTRIAGTSAIPVYTGTAPGELSIENSAVLLQERIWSTLRHADR